MFGLKLFSIVLVFLLSLGQLQQFKLFDLSIYFSDPLIVSFVLWHLWQQGSKQKIIATLKKKYQTQKEIFIPFFLLVGLGWLLAISAPQWWLGPLHLGRLVMYGLFVYFYAGCAARAHTLYTSTALLLAGWGLLQYFLLPDLRFIAIAGYDDHFYRLASTLLDPNFAGLIFTMTLSFYLSRRALFWPTIILLLLALWLTYSRAAYLAFGLNQLYLIYRGTNRRNLILLLLVFTFSLWWLPTQSGGAGVDLTRQASILARFDKDLAILQDIRPEQVFIGQGLLVPHQTLGFPNNWLVLVYQNLGLVGSLILGLLGLKCASQLNRQQIALTLVFLCFSLFNHSLTQQTSILLYLGLMFTDETRLRSSADSHSALCRQREIE